MNIPEIHVAGQINPELMQFNDIKIGDKVAIEMSAFHWIEFATIMHEHFDTPPALVQQLVGKIFRALTPEDYQKALLAEMEEAKERAMASHPLLGGFMQPPFMAEDARDDDD